MDRRDLRTWAAACGVVALAFANASVAAAQPLDRLHVRAFGLSVDPNPVAAGTPFRLRIDVRVAEQRTELDAVTLPDLSAFDNLGDERRCTATPGGTACTETVTLVARDPGAYKLGPATIAAINANTNLPSRFSTDVVTLRVDGPSLASRLAGGANDVLLATLRGLVFLLVGAIVLWLVLYAFTRPRKARAPEPIAPAVPEPVAATDPDAELRRALETLRAAPTRANAVAVRALLRSALGAKDGETMADLAARRSAANGEMRRLAALRAIERAAFCEDERVEYAVREALPFFTP